MINVCAISDLHGTLPEINPCELLLICGEIVQFIFLNLLEDLYGFIKKNMKIQNKIHSVDYNCVMINDTEHYNVSIKDEKYDFVYELLYLKIDK